MKKYANSLTRELKKSPFGLNLIKENGEMEDYYLVSGDVRNKLTLSDFVNEQISSLENASSGDYTQNASSGYRTQNASSGNYTQNASSGDYTQNASSGNRTQNASSGYRTQNASSGYRTIDETTGKNSITFSCGFRSIIKSAKGNWISLAEYERINGNYVPIFALSGQIGNEDYKDCHGKVLSENDFYLLHNKKFTPVINDDDILLIKVHSKTINGMEVIQCKDFDDKQVYCVRKDGYSSHGNTLKEAVADLNFKIMRNADKKEIVSEIKKTGFVTREQYRAITGACQFGTEQFAKEHGYADVEKVELNDLLSKLTDNHFGAREFKLLLKQ